ncbi:invasion associated locus B family protein [Agrobacterium vitis]|uniref:Invasion associated locus B family protein n=1 Tax=Agrobacterium vitis TaxID=373 RepID=A0AAE2RHQ0_AGRVI|nr:invasion associated locus B family protein [Agrobacterium vitis]MBF2717684.1 invasion associated locus B family protein [Agrobacterium vitis]
MTRETVQTSSLLSSTAVKPVLPGIGGIAPLAKTAAVLPVTISDGADEAFGEWKVAYVGREGRKIHVARYQRTGALTNRVGIDLGFSGNESMLGALTLPLGLKQKTGVRLQVDAGEISAKMTFVSAGSTGCVVKLGIDAEMIALLCQAERLNVYAQMASNAKKLVFPIPLHGFADAIERLRQIDRARMI